MGLDETRKFVDLADAIHFFKDKSNNVNMTPEQKEQIVNWLFDLKVQYDSDS